MNEKNKTILLRVSIPEAKINKLIMFDLNITVKQARQHMVNIFQPQFEQMGVQISDFLDKPIYFPSKKVWLEDEHEMSSYRFKQKVEIYK